MAIQFLKDANFAGTIDVADLPENSTSVSVLVHDETLGTELVTNGNFDSATGWTAQSGWAVSGGKANGTATTGAIYQAMSSMTASTKYRLTYTISGLTAGSVRVSLRAAVTTTQTTNGTFSEIVTSGTSSDTNFYIDGVAAFTGSIDNISLKQVTSSSNQILKRQIGSDVFTGGPFLPLAGGTMTGDINFNDSVKARFGDNNDLQIYHDGTNAYIDTTIGNTFIRNTVVDADVNFYATKSDGAGGGTTELYFQLDSSIQKNEFYKAAFFKDDIKAEFGDGSDLQIYHDGSNGYIKNLTGWLNVPLTENGMSIANADFSESVARFLIDGACELYYDGGKKFETTSTGISVISALLSNQENTDVDTGTETVASVAIATYTAAFFDFVIKKTTNVRSGTVYACHDGAGTPLVAFTETSTQDLGDTSDVTLSVDISGTDMRLRATTTSDNWSIKSLIRAI